MWHEAKPSSLLKNFEFIVRLSLVSIWSLNVSIVTVVEIDCKPISTTVTTRLRPYGNQALASACFVNKTRTLSLYTLHILILPGHAIYQIKAEVISFRINGVCRISVEQIRSKGGHWKFGRERVKLNVFRTTGSCQYFTHPWFNITHIVFRY